MFKKDLPEESLVRKEGDPSLDWKATLQVVIGVLNYHALTNKRTWLSGGKRVKSPELTIVTVVVPNASIEQRMDGLVSAEYFQFNK
ncbi:MAG: hypothetical protein ACTSUE_04820 [Promethearchaeota archaeon]